MSWRGPADWLAATIRSASFPDSSTVKPGANGPTPAAYWCRLRPLPGAADLLRACQRHGLRVVLASSAGPREFEVMRSALDAEDAVDEATSSGDVEASKPAPDLVQVALERAGVAPGEAVFVGDTV
jgi:HAD superfamily hydrolase (TIGR01509 family)